MTYSIGQAKAAFFDLEKVRKSAEKSTYRQLSKAGAFVRRTAKGLIRSQKKVSKAGNPPASHTGLLKQFIFFGLDSHKMSMFVGPVRLNRSDGSAPGLLERGGIGKNKKRYRKRPYMLPALEKEAPKFPQFWANDLK